MSVFGKLTAAVVETVLLPVELVKDVATLGGSVIGNDETFTGKRLRSIQDDLDRAVEEMKD